MLIVLEAAALAFIIVAALCDLAADNRHLARMARTCKAKGRRCA